MRYGRAHLAAVNLRNQMSEIRRAIVDELNRIAQSYRSDYEIAKAREESVTKGLASIVSVSQTTNQAQVVLRELESSAQTYRALHDNFLQRYMESVQQQSFPISEARLITHATRPARASHPRSLLILVLSAAGGVMLGFGLAMLRDISDRSFRTSDQVASILQTDCIAVLPQMKELAKGASERAETGLQRGRPAHHRTRPKPALGCCRLSVFPLCRVNARDQDCSRSAQVAQVEQGCGHHIVAPERGQIDDFNRAGTKHPPL